MWICPRCGEPHEDHFKVCWKCAGDEVSEEPAGAPAPPPAPVERKLRPARWVIARAAVGFAIGTLLGVAVFHRYGATLGQASVSGAVAGVTIGGIVGVFLWVVFPYEPTVNRDPEKGPHEPGV